MKFENGEAFLDGNSVMALDNIPVYHMNESLQSRRKKKEELEEKEHELYSNGAKKRESPLHAEYLQTSEELHKLQDWLHKTEADII